MNNNFDISSTGFSVEFTGYYEIYLSRYYFDENFKILRYSTLGQSSLSIFTDNGNFDNFEPEFTSDRPIRDIIWQVFEIYYNDHDYQEMKEFYDTPVSGTLTVNDKEFNVDEYLNDYYEWDKDEFLESLYKRHAFSEIEKEQIERVVPKYLEHLQ